MLTPELRLALPSTQELPCSDDTPVDNEDQNLLPNVLLFLLSRIWSERLDWYFGVDMAVYHTTGSNPRIPVVPDGFLSVGVERKKGGKSRLSYATWEENDVVPILVLEMVSHKAGGEYSRKMEIYSKLGVLYYVIYNPEFYRRDRHQPFEVYKLVAGEYQQQSGEPYWIPEVGLGIGRCRGQLAGLDQEMLGWFNAVGDRYLTGEEEAKAERHRAESESRRAEAAQTQLDIERRAKEELAQYLRSLGIDPDHLPPPRP